MSRLRHLSGPKKGRFMTDAEMDQNYDNCLLRYNTHLALYNNCRALEERYFRSLQVLIIVLIMAIVFLCGPVFAN